MKYICIKYSGLKFNYSFETNQFVFICKQNFQDVKDILPLEFFKLNFNDNSEFYLLYKDTIDSDFSLEHFTEEVFYKFRFFESITALLFSNIIVRKSIYVINNENSIEKVFKVITKKIIPNSDKLIFKNNIAIYSFTEIINDAFKKLDQIISNTSEDKVKDFVFRYSFCVEMYLRGKTGESFLRSSSDLWISLEVLSVITITYILHNHDGFEVKNVKNFFVKLKEIVKDASSSLEEENIDCWKIFKADFSDQMKNKINSHFSIRRKVITFAQQFLSEDDIKAKLPDFDDEDQYTEFYKKHKEFMDYQENLSLKKVIDFFYEIRNKLFHNGELDEDWSIEYDRYKSNFIKIIEQLLIKILDLKNIQFYQFGYPSQRILITTNKINDLSKYISLQQDLIMEKYILSKTKYDMHDPELKKYYFKSKNNFFPLCKEMNQKDIKIEEFGKKIHEIEINHEDSNFKCTLDYQKIEKKFYFLVPKKCKDRGEIFNLIQNLKEVNIKSKKSDEIQAIFKGNFIYSPDIYSAKGFLGLLLLSPNYITFNFY